LETTERDYSASWQPEQVLDDPVQGPPASQTQPVVSQAQSGHLQTSQQRQGACPSVFDGFPLKSVLAATAPATNEPNKSLVNM
jgi:hypothetical protein